MLLEVSILASKNSSRKNGMSIPANADITWITKLHVIPDFKSHVLKFFSPELCDQCGAEIRHLLEAQFILAMVPKHLGKNTIKKQQGFCICLFLSLFKPHETSKEAKSSK